MQILAAPSGGRLGAFTDTFAGSGALDPRWSNTFGSSWSRLFDDAYSSTAASSFPKVTFDAGTNAATLRADVGVANTFGWGVLFWVVDANNWWAAHTYRTSYTCQIGFGCNACGGNAPCGSPNCDCSFCDGPGCTGNCTFVANAGSGPIFGTCFNYQVDIIRSVNGTLTTMGNINILNGNIGGGLTIQYVQVATNAAGQITTTAAMSTGQTGSTTITPSSPNRGNRHGMIIVPMSSPTPNFGGTQADRIETFTYSPA